MATLHSDKEIAQAFRTLGHTDRRIGSGRIAAWAGWATIALFTVAFFSSVVFLLSSEQRAESVRLKQSADLVAQAMESRLLGTTELLMKTSLRLITFRTCEARWRAPNSPPRTSCRTAAKWPKS